MLTDMQLTEQDIWPGRTALLKTGMLLPPLELTFNARTPLKSLLIPALACYNNSLARRLV